MLAAASRVLIIGLDGATLDLVAPWAQAGYLPNLARLMHGGAWGELQSTLPPITAAAWASFMTGLWPDRHGVFDFFRGFPGHTTLVNATDIRGQTVWQMLSQAGRSVGVLNVPITYPPPAVNGFLVPGLLSPDQGHTTWPPGLLDPYLAQLGPYRLTPELTYAPGREAALIADLHAVLDTQVRYALRLAQDRPTDLLMVHFLVTDIAQHALWRHMDPQHPWHDPMEGRRFGAAIRDLFAGADAAIGQLLDHMGPETNVLVMSDHGFGPVHATANLNNLFIRAGLMTLRRNPGVRMRRWIAGQEHMAALGWRLARGLGRRKLVDFDDVDWARTQAYSLGHLGQVYINLQGRQPQGTVAPEAYESTMQRVIEALQGLADLAGLPVLRRNDLPVAIKTQIRSPQSAIRNPTGGPDLLVILDDYRVVAYPMFAADGRIVTSQQHGNSGDHRLQGLLIASGPGIRQGGRVAGARIVDVAPTILALMGAPIPQGLDGRVLASWLSFPLDAGAQEIAQTGADSSAPASAMLSPQEQARVEAQLRGLGYLG